MSRKKTSNPEKKYYLPDDKNKTPISHELFLELMREPYRIRAKMRRAGLCNVSWRYICMADCFSCPYICKSRVCSIEELTEAMAEPRDPTCIEDEIVSRMYEQDMIKAIKKLDIIDQIILRSLVINIPRTEAETARLVSQTIGRSYTQQAVHKRRRSAALRLAELIGLPY